MKTISSIEVLDNYKLLCSFSDGSKKIADISPYLSGEAFKVLQNPVEFSLVANKSYYVEWPKHEPDLSADTLWHIGANAPGVYS